VIATSPATAPEQKATGEMRFSLMKSTIIQDRPAADAEIVVSSAALAPRPVEVIEETPLKPNQPNLKTARSVSELVFTFS
jgi:hypothetical protein